MEQEDRALRRGLPELEGKTVLVTGGTSGIGGVSARLFAEEGATVIAVARNAERGEDFENLCRKDGLKVSFISCDVTDREQIKNIHEIIQNHFGCIDILMNNAGMLKTAGLEEITDNDWDNVYQTNLKSVLYTCQEFIDELVENKGVILNNASINGLHHYIKGARSYMYATSKAALIQFTQYLAKNYAPNVRVNCLCPGMTETNLFTNRDFSRFNGCNLLNRMAKPEEIANAALFLVSERSSFMTGSIVVVDGGETLKG